MAEGRQQERQLASALRGGDDKWDALPGTRAEVEALRRLFEGKPKLLFDSQASEQRLDELAAADALGHYRYLHLATHGIVDNRFPLNSALILSRDALPDPNKTEEIMAWCEGHTVDYLFGLEVNSRLVDLLGPALMGAHLKYLMTGVTGREWADFWYQTRHSWSQPRRVVAKAEFLPGGPNPRFVVTSVAPEVRPAQALYEEDYCGRGDVENRIKEQKLDLASGRTSIAQLVFQPVAPVVQRGGLRAGERAAAFGSEGHALGAAQCGTLRQRLFKIGGWVRVTARRVLVSLSEAFPLRQVFAAACAALGRLPSWPRPASVGAAAAGG